jgi:hypothetical protein
VADNLVTVRNTFQRFVFNCQKKYRLGDMTTTDLLQRNMQILHECAVLYFVSQSNYCHRSTIKSAVTHGCKFSLNAFDFGQICQHNRLPGNMHTEVWTAQLQIKPKRCNESNSSF